MATKSLFTKLTSAYRLKFSHGWHFIPLHMASPHHSGRVGTMAIAIAEKSVETEDQVSARLVFRIFWHRHIVLGKTAHCDQARIRWSRRLRGNNSTDPGMETIRTDQNAVCRERSIGLTYAHDTRLTRQ